MTKVEIIAGDESFDLDSVELPFPLWFEYYFGVRPTEEQIEELRLRVEGHLTINRCDDAPDENEDVA